MFAEFLSQNLLWVAAFVVVANLLVLSLLQANVKGAQTISALELPKLQRGDKAVIIDVNDEAQYSQSHIPQAVNFPVASINADNKDLQAHKNKTAIVVCQTGSRSSKAARSLIALGFTDVHILRGGLVYWTKENLPVSSA
ncbi:MAG: rhodanese-like domain-containing protein [Arenicella sp.]|nr:rhodanese-like domain-containing protein [Arenicella sp.]